MNLHITRRKLLLLGLMLVILLALFAALYPSWYQVHHPFYLPTSTEGITSITILKPSGYPDGPEYQKDIADQQGIDQIINALRKVRFTGKISEGTPAGGGATKLTFHYTDREDYSLFYFYCTPPLLFPAVKDAPEGYRPSLYIAKWPIEEDLWDTLDYPVTIIPFQVGR